MFNTHKKPKVLSIPESQKKEVKIESDPAKFKSCFISWQLGLIDFESEWGIDCFKEKIRFKYDCDLIDKLEHAPEDLKDAINNMDESEYESIDEFLKLLSKKTKISFSIDIQRVVLGSLRRHFFDEKIYPKLKHFESKNWFEIEKEGYGYYGKTKHHSINISKLDKKAQERLRKLKLDDIDEVFSFRLDGTLRIFGIRKFGYLQILWFDLDHKVCPP